MSAFHLLPYGVSIEENASSQGHVAGKRRAFDSFPRQLWIIFGSIRPPQIIRGSLQDGKLQCSNWNHQRAQRLSRVRLSATPWTLAPQTPPSVGIPQARTRERVAHALLPGTLLVEGLNLRLLNWQVKFLTTSASWEALGRISLFCPSWIDWCRGVCRMSHLPAETASQRETQWTPQETRTCRGDVLPSA